MAPERTPTMAEGEDVAGVMPEEIEVSQEFEKTVALFEKQMLQMQHFKKSKKIILKEMAIVVFKLCEIQNFVELCQLKDIYEEMMEEFIVTGRRCVSVKEIQEAVSKLELDESPP